MGSDVPAMTTADLLSRLNHVVKNGDGWTARCPAHDDRNPSLSVAAGADGRIVLHCHAGCTPENVCAAIGITLADLFADKPERNGHAKQIVATYPYRDASGRLLFEVVRFEPKDFRQRRPDPTANDGWRWDTKAVKKVLFRLPELAVEMGRRMPIFVCEGEKDVLAMVEYGFAATCNPGGAGKWLASYTDTLRGADVIVIADKDAPGKKHARAVTIALHGVAKTVKVIECPEINGKSVKDVADYLAAGGQACDLDEMARAAPLYVPPPNADPGPAAVEDRPADFDGVTAWIRGQILDSMQDLETPASVKNSLVASHVVKALALVGKFYFHLDLRDFDTAMFFDASRKWLERIRSDSFSAWLADWLRVNRATGLFKYVLSAVETAALSGPHTTGILPESYWAARPGALYLSNGDGAVVKITAGEIKAVDNGTDGILFAAGRTLAPWRLTAPKDPFETCALFRNVHCGAAHGKDLLRLWFYSFATMPRSKPSLVAIGEIGSGKTRTLKGIAELYGIPFRAAKVEEQLEPNSWPNVNEGGLFILDNADSKCRWLADAVAAAATDGCSQRRKLYTNSETVILRANAWLGVTSANPTFGNDAGLADRLLVVRMERRGDETSDAALTDEILANRDAGLSHIAATLQKALADGGPTAANLNARHPDFADFAVKIGRALGREKEAVQALRTAEADKSAFCLENDAIGAALLAHLNGAQSFTGTAAELAPHIIAADKDLDGKLSAKRLGKRLSALWPHLQKVLPCRKETNRNGVAVFTFKAADAGFAGFQTDFSQNP
jgi:5S rRNA maturation endonuclease (ribonuclease M5)